MSTENPSHSVPVVTKEPDERRLTIRSRSFGYTKANASSRSGLLSSLLSSARTSMDILRIELNSVLHDTKARTLFREYLDKIYW
jgi:hypothetical protein